MVKAFIRYVNKNGGVKDLICYGSSHREDSVKTFTGNLLFRANQK